MYNINTQYYSQLYSIRMFLVFFNKIYYKQAIVHGIYVERMKSNVLMAYFYFICGMTSEWIKHKK